MILVADDFESERNLVKGILEELGFEVAEAVDGHEAIELLQFGNSFEAVITDFNMPYKNGSDVVKEARLRNVPKILLRSSHSVATLREKVETSGIELMCKRDFDASELRVWLREFLG